MCPNPGGSVYRWHTGIISAVQPGAIASELGEGEQALGRIGQVDS